MKKLIILIIFVCLGLLSLISPQSIEAQDTLFSDDFSRDLSKWQSIRDDGRYWNIQNGSLEAVIPFGATVSELLPLDAFWTEANSYLIDLEYTSIQGADKNIAFGVIDKNNWYELHFTPSASHVVKVKNGIVIWQEIFPYILSSGIKHHLSITYIKGKITVLVNGSQIIETTDPTFTNTQGKIAVKATTGAVFPTKIRIDNILVRKIKDTPQKQGVNLGVALLRQDDERWSNLEYDTAHKWTTEEDTGISIKEWGCNLLSQLMILHHHGITKLPDGTEITPISLNNWLLNNEGYYSNPPSGNIDRKSISRLTAELNKVHNTPKLEFLYVGENILPTAISEIEKGNPVILELEGHFVVADGFTEDKADLYIKDPSYTITKLSEHPLPVKSVRLFTPTYTDLSYISLSSKEQIPITIKSQDLSFQTNHYVEQTRLFSDRQESITSPNTYITEIAKPSTGSYTITINNTSSNSQIVNATIYTLKGTYQQFTLTVKKGEHIYLLNFDKDGLSTLTEANSGQLSYKDFRKTVKALANRQLIKEPYFEKVLLQLIKPAEKLSLEHQKKLLRVIRVIISTAPRTLISRPAQALLLDQVGLLLAQLK